MFRRAVSCVSHIHAGAGAGAGAGASAGACGGGPAGLLSGAYRGPCTAQAGPAVPTLVPTARWHSRPPPGLGADAVHYRAPSGEPLLNVQSCCILPEHTAVSPRPVCASLVAARAASVSTRSLHQPLATSRHEVNHALASRFCCYSYASIVLLLFPWLRLQVVFVNPQIPVRLPCQHVYLHWHTRARMHRACVAGGVAHSLLTFAVPACVLALAHTRA